MEELAQYLKSERLRRGLSLQDVMREAGMSISLLRTLEQGQFLEIGPPSLVYSHLSAYSQALENIQLSSTDTGAADSPPTILTSPEPSQSLGTCLLPRKSEVLILGSLVAVGLLVLGICCQIGWLSPPDRGHSSSHLSSLGTSPESPVESKTASGPALPEDSKSAVEELSHDATLTDAPADLMPQQVAEQEVPAPSPSAPGGSAEENVSSQPVALYHRFEIEAFQESWVEIKKDGRKSEAFLLHPGEKREWQVDHELHILVGNAGGVRMLWDGAPLNLGGRPGQVLRFRLPHPDLTGKSP